MFITYTIRRGMEGLIVYNPHLISYPTKKHTV